MTNRAVCAIALVVMFTGPLAAEPAIEPGLYEITYSLELPHLERYAIARTATVCIGPGYPASKLPLPILGSNGAYEGCPVQRLKAQGQYLSYETVCAGRAAARATAKYRLEHGRLQGRIKMMLGAKNMTMTEVQSGRRLAGCSLAGQSVD